MEKITYLLGAGASAQCIPVVNDMAKSIEETSGLLYKRFFKNVPFFTQDEKVQSAVQATIDEHNKKLLHINKDLEWLKTICGAHYSIDTYAKKIYLKNDNDVEYLRLKNILSFYFTIQQVLVPPDKRYDNFWASILDSRTSFPGQLRILSWNYDSQLELSYKNFCSKVSLDEAYRKIGMASFHDYSRKIEPNEFGIFKLNGSAKLYTQKEGRNISNYLIDDFNFENVTDSESDEELFKKLYNSYLTIHSNPTEDKASSIKNEISFAWEHDTNQDYYKKLNASIIDTKTLVVIGYSFPFFNRKIDKLIINEYMPALEKVYFQAPDAENLKERFLSINDKIEDKDVFLRMDKNQFTFPNELDI